MNCRECRGACCESIVLPLPHLTEDTARWVLMRAQVRVVQRVGRLGDRVEIDVKCSKLTPEGACGIYDERPFVCEFFIAGGSECLDTVRRRRTPEEYARIRGPEDPETIHG